VTETAVQADRPSLTRSRWTITAAFGLGGITISAWGPRLPAIKTSLGVDTATIGLLLAGVTIGAMLGLVISTAFAIGEALARIFGGPIVDRLGRVRTIRVTTALGVVGIVLFIEAGNLWIILAGVLLWSVGVSMGFPLGMSAAAESGPDPAARVSVVASVGYFASLAGPPVIGVLAQSVGLLHALWLIAAMFVAAFAAAGSLGRREAAT